MEMDGLEAISRGKKRHLYATGETRSGLAHFLVRKEIRRL